MTTLSGKDVKITFGDVDLSTEDARLIKLDIPTKDCFALDDIRGFRYQYGMQISGGIVTERGMLNSLPGTDERLIFYPYGRYWFLPHWEVEGRTDWTRLDNNTYRMDFTQHGEVRVIKDNRVHASLLRWFWLKIRRPIVLWWAWRKRHERS